MKEKGRVEWYDRKLGYGFIVRDNKESDIFVHVSKLVDREFLDAGDIVEFEVRDIARRDGKKLQAFDVSLIQPATVSTSKLENEASHEIQ